MTCRALSLSTWHQVTSRKFGHGGQVPEETELKVRILKTFGGEFQVTDSGLGSEFIICFRFILADEVPDIAARSLRQREGQDRGSVEGSGVQLNMALFQL